MKAIELILKHFEGFAKRAIMPSISFIFIFLSIYSIFIFFNNEKKISELKILLGYLVDINNLVVIVIFLGFSLFLGILNQAIYDNLLKDNFDFCLKESSLLKTLRNKVIDKLKKEKVTIVKDLDELYLTDNYLYQIVGKGQKTERYVDDAKHIGIFFICLILSFIICGFLFESFIISVFISIICYFIGFELVKSKYRSRAIRIYTNYIFTETKKEVKVEVKKETKIIYRNRIR